MKILDEFANSILPHLKRFARHALIYLTPFIGAAIVFYSIYSVDVNSKWISVLQSIGVALIMSGIISYWASALNSFDFFGKKLRMIVFGDDFTKIRNDIDVIWDKVSKAMYKEKFPELSEKIHKSIKEKYFPREAKFYTTEYDLSIKYEIVDKEKKHIRIIETSRQLVVSHSNEEFQVIFGCSANFSKIHSYSKIEFNNFWINGSKIIDNNNQFSINIGSNSLYQNSNNSLIITPFIEKETFGFDGKLLLKGERTYEIVRQITKEYCANINPIYFFEANSIFNKMTLNIEKPRELFVEFIDAGVPYSFEDILTDNEMERIKKINSEIILPRQGFALGISILDI